MLLDPSKYLNSGKHHDPAKVREEKLAQIKKLETEVKEDAELEREIKQLAELLLDMYEYFKKNPEKPKDSGSNPTGVKS